MSRGEQLTRLRYSTLGEQLAHKSRRDASPLVERDVVYHYDLKTVEFSQLTEQRNIASTARTEAEVCPHENDLGIERFCQHSGNEIFGRHLAQGSIKGQNESGVDFGRCEAFKFLLLAEQRLRAGGRVQKTHRIAVEGDHDRTQAALSGNVTEARENRAVAAIARSGRAREALGARRGSQRQTPTTQCLRERARHPQG